MSHDKSLKKLLDSTGNTDDSSNRSLKADAAGGLAGDVSLKKDFNVDSVNSPAATYHDIPGAEFTVSPDHYLHEPAYAVDLGKISIKLIMPNARSPYNHITVKLYDDTGSLLQTGTGYHGQIINFRGLDSGTEGFRVYVLEMLNTNGGMGQTFVAKVDNESRQPWVFQTLTSSPRVDQWYDTPHFQLSVRPDPHTHSDESPVGTTKPHRHYDIPHISGDSITKQGITIPHGGSITLSPIFGNEAGRFTRVKKESTHYEWAITAGSGMFTITETTVNGNPALTVANAMTNPGYKYTGKVTLRYSDEWNEHATNYNNTLEIPVTLLGGDFPGMVYYSKAETLSTYYDQNDAAVYVVGIAALTPTTTSWRISLLDGTTLLQQATRTGQWFFSNPVTFSSINTIQDSNNDGTADSYVKKSYTIKLEDLSTGATRTASIPVGYGTGTQKKWVNVLPPKATAE